MTHPTKAKVMRQIKIDLIEYFDLFFTEAERTLNSTNVYNRAEFLLAVQEIQMAYIDLGKQLDKIEIVLTKTPSPMAGQLTLIKDEEE